MYTMVYYSTVLLYPQFLILIIILHVLLISASLLLLLFLISPSPLFIHPLPKPDRANSPEPLHASQAKNIQE